MKDRKEFFKNKITLRMIAEGFGGLQRNGLDFVCPIIPPLPMRQVATSGVLGGGAKEQITVSKACCNTGCPLFEIESNPTIDKLRVHIRCGGSPVTYDVDEIIPLDSSDKKEGIIIPMGGGGTA